MQIMWAAKEKLDYAPEASEIVEPSQCEFALTESRFLRESQQNRFPYAPSFKRSWLDRLAPAPWQHAKAFLSTSVRNLGTQGIAADLWFVSGKNQAIARVHRSARPRVCLVSLHPLPRC